jgi:hypothetical protein
MKLGVRMGLMIAGEWNRGHRLISMLTEVIPLSVSEAGGTNELVEILRPLPCYQYPDVFLCCIVADCSHTGGKKKEAGAAAEPGDEWYDCTCFSFGATKYDKRARIKANNKHWEPAITDPIAQLIISDTEATLRKISLNYPARPHRSPIHNKMSEGF